MIQDINGKFNLDYKIISPRDNDYVLSFLDDNIQLINNDIPMYKDINANNLIYGFSIDSNRYFINLDDAKEGIININVFRNFYDREKAFAMITGYHLYTWYKNNKYCGRCGKRLTFGIKERSMICDCGNIVYPRINPAVIVGLIHNDKILLTKYRKGYKSYALVAGFTEIGESFEETVRREVFEEVGLHVGKIEYYKSQPWGLSGSVLSGYFAYVIDENDTPILEVDELKEAKWFKKEEIDLVDNNTSLTREMILYFKNGGLDNDASR